ncbi:hypothetical protein N473_07510 [Pseudoalteromonas luteoviolacea CPMOR-1]|uniref:Novel toxin 10 domain-containing protein n=1 Tax=Pseudoalteromonas luteoviolacea CPMOR-1 TaxID=1365248 RepID=A0A162CHW9_9GAMM|nr:RHS repeat-associated core domain-containing protein [Pseudoalteromonas luteoviolacea]KZN68264.1 hypothetical protein N473_07510 [Pseudoalteromonas luteoviolacea CPMOR-1]
MKFTMRCKLGLLAGLLPLQALALSDPSKLPDYAYNYKEYTNNSTEVETLTTDLLGDKVDLANGGFSISHNELSLTVNGGLKLDLTRTFSDPDSWFHSTKEFGSWSLKLPHLRSVYATDTAGTYDNASAWAKGNACTANVGATPNMVYNHTIFHDADDIELVVYRMHRDAYWSGDSLSLIDEPSYKLLEKMTGGPNENKFKKTTKASHEITCYTAKSGNEGFKVISPNGITYYLDEMRQIAGRNNLRMSAYVEQGCVPFNCPPKQVPTGGGGSPSGSWVEQFHVFMLPSKIEDKFGNTIEFNYLENGKIDYITTSDNQRVDFTWDPVEERIESINHNGRVWQYDYRIVKFSDARRYNLLEKVTLPNLQTWIMEYGNDKVFETPRLQIPGAAPGCIANEGLHIENFITVKHPNGTSGQFGIRDLCKGITDVPRILKIDPNGFTEHDDVWVPKSHAAYSLVKKTLNIPGVSSPLIWSYDYTGEEGSFSNILNVDHTKVTTVTNPDNSYIKHHHSRRYGVTQNNLLKEETYSKDHKKLKEVSYDYHYGDNQGAGFGEDRAIVFILNSEKSFEPQRKDFTSNINVEVSDVKTTIFKETNQSVYSTKVLNFNEYDKPDLFTLTNHVNAESKHVRLTHFHDLETNSLNQPSKVFVSETDLSQINTNGTDKLAAWTQYAPYQLTNQGTKRTVHLPSAISVHGQLKKTFNTYHGHGGLEKVTFNDGTGKRVIRYSDYKHNTAQTITLPNRYFDAQSMSINKVIDENGWVRQIKNLNDVTTYYDYDKIGRITSVDLTNDTGQNWLDTHFTWNDDTLTRSVRRCFLNALGECEPGTVEYLNVEQYDGLYRLISKTETDLSKQASSINPTRYQRFSYDYKNQPTFESFPSFDALEARGTSTFYDALGRKESVTVSGLGTTRFEYLSGHKMSVTDAKGHTTKTTYQAFGSPAYDIATLIESPESVTTAMDVNLFGLVESITQSGEGVSVTETRKYDDNQNLCLIIRPDVGNTLMGHNALGQVVWQKQGVDNTQCVTTQPSDATVFEYDNLGDSHTVTFPVGTPSLTYEHDNNGNLLSLTAGSVNHTYYYNNQGALELERLTINNTLQSEVDYGYNSALAQSYIAYPDGTTVHYSPNGFGQPTRAVVLDANGAVELAFAEDVSYHPTGQPARFIYGNKAVHSLALDPLSNLPKTLTDTLGTSALVNLTYDYDSNANVTAITDNVNNAYSLTSLVYDGLNRLREVQGGVAIGNSEITYDTLGNISTYKSKDRDLTYHYQKSSNRLERVTGLGTGGKYGAINYDARGNVTHNGGFAMDYNLANQMVEAKGNRYLYDGHNRRVKQEDGNGTSYSLYSQSGVLLYREKDAFAGEGTSYIYLGKKLIAKYGDVTPPTANNDRQYHRPFGETINQPKDDVGYTGHKFDTDLNLSYMQARYYDPVIGRFYSNDPVGFKASNVHSFGRYTYANNNPYKYVDPDGNYAESVWDAASLAVGITSLGNNISEGNWGASALDTLGVVADGVAIALPIVPGGAGMAINATRGAESAVNAVKLEKQLASESQLTQLSEGGGTVISQPAKQADRIAAQHGVEASNVQKVSSDAHVAKDGQTVQTHAFRDASTNKVLEPKTIIDENQ